LTFLLLESISMLIIECSIVPFFNSIPRFVLFILAIVHCGFSFLLVTSYCWNNIPVIVHIGIQDLKAAEKLKKELEKKSYKRKSNKTKKMKKESFTDRLFYKIYFALRDFSSLYYLIFLVASGLGIRWPELYAFHMLDFCIQSPSIRNVLKAVTTNGRAIILTLFLVLVLAYIYAMIGFVAFSDLYGETLGTDCSEVYYCLLSTISVSIWGGSGVAGATSTLAVTDSDFLSNYVYTMTFYIFIILIVLNVVLGIILDTFGQLREERNSVEEDMTSKCFVCIIEAEKFQRDALGFDNHIRNEHNMWHYLYFYVYLKLKPVSEYTASEYYVHKQNKKHKIDYFPVNRAVSLLSGPEVQEE